MEAKQVKDLMEAYASIVSPSESEGELVDEGLGAKAAELLDRGTKAIQSNLEKAGVPINRQKRGTVTKAEQESRIKNNVKEETDLFDVILEYLVAEGYADTNQAALVIMANMSEEWKKSIVEQRKDDLEAPDYKDAKRIMNRGSGSKASGEYKGNKPGYDPITGIRLRGV